MSQKSPIVVLGARVPRPLVRALKLAAVKEDRTIQSIVEEALRNALRERGVALFDDVVKTTDAA